MPFTLIGQTFTIALVNSKFRALHTHTIQSDLL